MRLVFCFVFFLLSLDASQWSAEKALSIAKIESVSVAPSFLKTAYLVQRANLDKQIWEKTVFLFDHETGATLQFMQDLEGELSWSRDSRTIWFLAKGALWKKSIDSESAEKIYEPTERIESYAISPDGTKLAYVTKLPAREKYLPAKAYKLIQPKGLWIKKLTSSDAPHLITTDEMCVGFRDEGRLSWSPDSAFVAFSYIFVGEKENVYDQRWLSHLALADSKHFSYKDLLREESLQANPHYSHDGKWIAFTSNSASLKEKQFFFNEVQIVSPDGKSRKSLAVTFDQRAEILGWARDDERVFIKERKGIKEKIYELPRDGKKPKPWGDSEANFIPFLNQSGEFFGLISQEFEHPPEVFISSVSEYQPKKISSLQLQDAFQLGTVQVIQWKAKDGTPIEAILVLPATYQKDKPLPLVLACHGGPTDSWVEEFIGQAEEQAIPISFGLLADAGYAVLAPNPRGSIGYGPQFAIKNFKDLGGKDLQDLFSGIDLLIKQGIADGKRLAIWGWSYGGYLSARAITQTSRFKAAIVGAGLTNLLSFDGTSDLSQVYLSGYFGTHFWKDPKLYLKRSPIMEIAKVKTPTLLQYGMEDLRVPISQGIEFFHGLRVRDVPSELFSFPEGHAFTHNPQSVVEGLKQLLDWLDKYL